MESNHEAFERAIQSFSDEVKTIARQTRQLIYTLLPHAVEVVWVHQKNTGFGTGLKKRTEHFCWLMPASKHVTLGFNYGAELPDPTGLLVGTGQVFRHIKIKSVDQLADQALIELLRYSTTYRVPTIERIPH